MNRNQFNSPFSQINSPDRRWQSPPINTLRDSPSPDFIPFEYSSPLSSFKQNTPGKVRGHFQKSHNRLYDKSFSSPSSTSSIYSPFNHSSGFNQSNRSFKNRNIQRNFNNKYDTTLYYHESMIQNPWEQLEKQLIEDGELKIIKDDSNKSNNNFIDCFNSKEKVTDDDNVNIIIEDKQKCISIPAISTIDNNNLVEVDSTNSDL